MQQWSLLETVAEQHAPIHLYNNMTVIASYGVQDKRQDEKNKDVWDLPSKLDFVFKIFPNHRLLVLMTEQGTLCF